MTKLAPTDMLCFALYSASFAMQKAYQPLLDPLRLTYPQYLVLRALWSEDDRTVGDLGRELHLESNTLTPLIKRLEGKDLVARARDRSDERQVRVKLTDAGRALETAAGDVPRCILEKTGRTVDEVQRLRDEIFALARHLRET